MAKSNKEYVWAITIVVVVALFGVSAFFSGLSSTDLSGHATSAIKTKSSAKTSTKTTSTACTDSDGGKEYSEKGTTKGIMWSDQNSGVKEYVDSCKDSTSLKEFRCVSDDGTTEGTAFAYFNTVTCTEGYCLDGICVSGCYDEGNTVTVRGVSYENTCCSDSTEDRACEQYSDNRLITYSCRDGGLSTSYASCTRGTTCVNGACV